MHRIDHFVFSAIFLSIILCEVPPCTAGNTVDSDKVPVNAKVVIAKADVMQPVRFLFKAMREKDESKILAQFSDGANLQRITRDQLTKSTPVNKFAKSIASFSGMIDEQIFSLSVYQEGNLAIVWAPFALYIDGALKHCGVNSFQLVNLKTGWKIQNLVDTNANIDCTEFIQKYKQQAPTTRLIPGK